MKYVAVNTAGPIIEIAVVAEDKQGYKKLEKVMASTQLLPAIDDMLDEMGLALSDFDDFVCVVGPGSFTGIRIGVNTVRAFAYALNKNAYGVTYNRVMAYNNSDVVLTVADGGNGVCYVAAYDGDRTLEEPTCIYKKDIELFAGKYSTIISDYDIGRPYVADGTALMKAAEFAIKNKLGTDPLYIRKSQPDRKESDI